MKAGNTLLLFLQQPHLSTEGCNYALRIKFVNIFVSIG